MPRFFCRARNIRGGEIIIDDPADIHHIRDVLRLQPGSRIEISDNKEKEFSCSIAEIAAACIILTIIEEKPISSLAATRLTIACAVPKKSMMDDIVDKLTQLGVDRIIPMETANVVVRLNPAKKALRLVRWNKIVQSAAKQSRRASLPAIAKIEEFKDVLSAADNYDLKLIPTLNGERTVLKDAAAGIQPKNILVLIGPEGDFSGEEVEYARRRGCLPVSLGETVFRVDTAAIAIASYFKLTLL